MKKFLLVLLLSLVTLPAFSAFRYGPMVGINGSTLTWRQDLVTTKSMVGGSVGVLGELMIPGIGFGIDMGLRYQLNGAKVNFGERYVWGGPPHYMGNESVLFHTLQIPIDLRFKYTRLNGVERIVAPFVFAGPVFTFNLATNKVPVIEHPAGTVDIQFGLGAELIERLQIFGGYYFGVSYQVQTIKLDNFSARPQGWFINAAWLF